MTLAGCQINPIDVNVYPQKSVDTVDKNSADKIWSKKYEGWKVPSLMPIKVKILYKYLHFYSIVLFIELAGD